jgi:hypothetical protein
MLHMQELLTLLPMHRGGFSQRILYSCVFFLALLSLSIDSDAIVRANTCRRKRLHLSITVSVIHQIRVV